MATLKERPDNWASRGIKRRDFQHSHDGPEEIPHKKRGKTKTKKSYKGCPERDGKAHIYVWIEFRGKRWRWSNGTNKAVDSTWWEKRCVGCAKRGNVIYPWGWGTASQPTEIYEVRNVNHENWW